MQQLETDLNYISSLPDRPAMATDALKREFDKAGNAIKDYINSIMIPDLVTYQTELQASVASQINSVRTELEGAMSTLQTTLEGEMQELSSSLTEALNAVTGTANSKVSYGDFAFTTETISGTLNMGAYRADAIALSKSGYYPLGLIGEENDQEAIDIRKSSITSRNNGGGALGYKIQNEDYGNNRPYTIKFYVLWVKVR